LKTNLFTYLVTYSLANLIQESGRAGRNMPSAKHILFWSRKDLTTLYSILAGGTEW